MWKRRGKDQTWEIIKYKVDSCYYARCSCGYEYNCSVDVLTDRGWTFSETKFDTTNYCPNCGARKYLITKPHQMDEYPPHVRIRRNV